MKAALMDYWARNDNKDANSMPLKGDLHMMILFTKAL